MPDSPAENSKPPVRAPSQPPTGLRDLYPADLNRLRYIQDAWRRVSINHGFEEIDGPTFEDADLYAVKSGEGILNEVFGVFSGKNPEERARLAAGGNAPFALRPEFTPTLARMYAARAGGLPKPTKWFWTQNCFRAERPQRGRLREFYQWNCDIIGLDGESQGPRGDDEGAGTVRSAHARADAECVATCAALLKCMGLTPSDVRIKLNHRNIVTTVLRASSPALKGTDAALTLLDRRGKIGPEGHERFALECTDIGFDIRAFDERMASLDFHKLLQARASDDRIRDGAPTAGEYGQLAQNLFDEGLAEWIEHDSSIVRGLAYYTGMVFEVHEVSGAERAIAGGGRYDGLIQLFGGPPTPAVGFGMGDVVLSNLLVDKGLMPTDDQIAERLGQRPDIVVIANGTPEAEACIGPTIAALRTPAPASSGRDRFGLHARRSYKSTKNVGKLIQDAAKMRARFCLIIESAATAHLKNMDTGSQDPVPMDMPDMQALRSRLL